MIGFFALRHVSIRTALLFVLAASSAFAQQAPRVLIVDAHPDDEVTYAGAVYKLTHELGGSVDLVVITDGQAGYKYSTLAEPYYQLKLTNEDTGRKYLPRIRHQEQENAGTIIGLGKIFFLDQRDNRYTLDPHEVLDSNWNIPLVKSRLADIFAKGHYDFVITLAPTDSTHGHHKAATILALEAVKALPAPRPVILAGSNSDKGQKPRAIHGLAEFPITHITDAEPIGSFDRLQGFGFHHALNYKIIVNWEIAEHKSQGTEQTGMNRGDSEDYYYYDINPPEGRAKTKAFFEMLAKNTHPELTYPGVK